MKKNPPDGADMQKNQKQILKLLYVSPLLMRPQGYQTEVSKDAPGSTEFECGGLVH